MSIDKKLRQCMRTATLTQIRIKMFILMSHERIGSDHNVGGGVPGTIVRKELINLTRKGGIARKCLN